MVLRCSLLGHNFGDTEVEREREERGSEVVVTVQEFEECSRCGERTVISENTEVTSLAAGTGGDSHPDDHGPEPTESPLEPDATDESAPETDAAFTDAGESGETAAAFTDTGESPSETDAEFIDADDPDSGTDAEIIDTNDSDSGSDAVLIDDGEPNPETDAEFIDSDADAAASTAESAPEHSDTVAPSAETADADIDLPTDANGDPVTDDGEILEDDDDPAPKRDREHGEWPDSSDVGPPVSADSSPATWPDDDDDAASEAPSHDVEPDPTADDDAVVLDNDVPPSGTGDARSVTADPPADATDDAPADATSEPDTGIERVDSVPTPTERDSDPADDVPTEFYCPRCDYVTTGDRGSLRAGDICPDCRKGYLSERERR